MKKILYSLTALWLVSLAGCADHREDGWPESTISLVKTGFQEQQAKGDVTQATASLWATKSGIKSQGCTVIYTVDEAYLAGYNTDNGTSYQLLPSNCYSIPQATFEMSGDQISAEFRVLYNPSLIVDATGGYNVKDMYALPIRVTASPLQVTDADRALLTFDISAP